MSSIPTSIQIADKDTIRWVVKEQGRRQQLSATRTANDLIRERLMQLDTTRRELDPVMHSFTDPDRCDLHGGSADVTPAECKPSACPCGQWPGPDEPEADTESGGAG